MKGKILNYLVIIGVSIILLLGIVTTAVAQDNSNSDNDNKCSKYNVRLHYNRNPNDTDVIAKLSPCIKVTKIGTFKNNPKFAKIQLDKRYDFLIREKLLKCSDSDGSVQDQAVKEENILKYPQNCEIRQ
ncbi:MAG: hypothetical protein F6K50_19845 [Moorea sp. SIO3I7]|uniref:hypothetical protein n=1 Tax=unclassified Moorena TaxID=2683338 RepID=UPI0013C16A5C|nr:MULTISPECIES: hypothetical protein [unclassified Moorena]NEN97697.1 hypothetical protein [Moorena sp. SIO3I7]NEO09147.1 hypothetical protein [Moorena sp. SIO3I8]NEP23701.1 hypothetical protein [Moorena sp. SIO3I6]